MENRDGFYVKKYNLVQLKEPTGSQPPLGRYSSKGRRQNSFGHQWRCLARRVKQFHLLWNYGHLGSLCKPGWKRALVCFGVLDSRLVWRNTWVLQHLLSLHSHQKEHHCYHHARGWKGQMHQTGCDLSLQTLVLWSWRHLRQDPVQQIHWTGGVERGHWAPIYQHLHHLDDPSRGHWKVILLIMRHILRGLLVMR